MVLMVLTPLHKSSILRPPGKNCVSHSGHKACVNEVANWCIQSFSFFQQLIKLIGQIVALEVSEKVNSHVGYPLKSSP